MLIYSLVYSTQSFTKICKLAVYNRGCPYPSQASLSTNRKL